MSPVHLKFHILGRAAPGGSKTFYGSGHVVDAAKGNKQWRSDVGWEVKAQYGRPPLKGPLEIWVTFWIERPKYHYRTGKYSHLLRDDAPAFHTVVPDTTKLLRAFEDALTGILWVDDAQIHAQHVGKEWCRPGDQASVRLEVKEAEGESNNA